MTFYMQQEDDILTKYNPCTYMYYNAQNMF